MSDMQFSPSPTPPFDETKVTYNQMGRHAIAVGVTLAVVCLQSYMQLRPPPDVLRHNKKPSCNRVGRHAVAVKDDTYSCMPSLQLPPLLPPIDRTKVNCIRL